MMKKHGKSQIRRPDEAMRGIDACTPEPNKEAGTKLRVTMHSASIAFPPLALLIPLGISTVSKAQITDAMQTATCWSANDKNDPPSSISVSNIFVGAYFFAATSVTVANVNSTNL